MRVRHLAQVTCDYCRKAFSRRTDSICPSKPRFCSPTCSNRAHKKFGTDNPAWKTSPKNPNRPHPLRILTCSWCQKTFVLSRGVKHKYCSDECLRNGRTRAWQQRPRKEKLYHEGYVLVYRPDHPKARYGRVHEHLVVWEEANSRHLTDGWVIHHLNGVKTDNRLRNLSALPSMKHMLVLAAKAKRIRELEELLNGR